MWYLIDVRHIWHNRQYQISSIFSGGVTRFSCPCASTPFEAHRINDSVMIIFIYVLFDHCILLHQMIETRRSLQDQCVPKYVKIHAWSNLRQLGALLHWYLQRCCRWPLTFHVACIKDGISLLAKTIGCHWYTVSNIELHTALYQNVLYEPDFEITINFQDVTSTDKTPDYCNVVAINVSSYVNAFGETRL